MSIFSAIAPSSKSIQKEYVDKRLRQLKRESPADTPRIHDLIVKLQQSHRIDPARTPWTETYTKLLMALSAADLTINLDAGDWFMKDTPNTYPTYKQTYERAVQPGGALALKDDEHNKAVHRTIADDLTTLPDEWANAHRFSQRRRLYKALNASGANHSMAASVMKIDADPMKKHKELTLTGDGKAGVNTTNTHFKPKAKEVFAALNYGNRKYGSNTTYGFSYLVLNPEFKRRALYYPADTFYIAGKGTKTQASYQTLGSLLLNFNDDMLDDLWNVAHTKNWRGADTSDGMMMVEAHIFKRVKMDTDVAKLVLARKRRSSKAVFADADWEECKRRARDWAKRFGGIAVEELPN